MEVSSFEGLSGNQQDNRRTTILKGSPCHTRILVAKPLTGATQILSNSNQGIDASTCPHWGACKLANYPIFRMRRGGVLPQTWQGKRKKTGPLRARFSCDTPSPASTHLSVQRRAMMRRHLSPRLKSMLLTWRFISPSNFTPTKGHSWAKKVIISE